MTTPHEPDRPTTYQPVDCSLHDRYEAWAVRRTLLTVAWSDGESTGESDQVRIADTRVANAAEYLILSDGTQIRLDHIVRVTPVSSS